MLHGTMKKLSIKSTHYNKIIVCLREKVDYTPVKDSRNRESESKGDLYVDITYRFSFLRFNSKGKACILNWNLDKES